MGTYCMACEQLIESETMHMPKKCPYCGNTDRTKFVRADEDDMDPRYQKKHQEDKQYLESRREE